MAEKIQIQRLATETAKDKIVELVECPKLLGELRSANKCKSCQNCRIYLENYVKCTYKDDRRRAELRPEIII